MQRHMKNEGMGKRFSLRDMARDINDQERDAIHEAFNRLKEQVVEDLLFIDQRDKALTGRKIQHYAGESGIKETELFPEGAHILNIGDPWQVLDKEGITTLEYETGEEAAFVYDTERFLASILPTLERMQELVTQIKNADPLFATSLAWRLHAIRQHIEYTHVLRDYQRESKVLYEITRLIAEHHQNDDGVGASRELWYAAMRLARGFEDIFYRETVIDPAIKQETLRNKGLTQEDSYALTRHLIEAFRGKKKYKHSELVKGAFPNTSFADQSFDRITASWSLSAHMFGIMDGRQYTIVWKELDRILKQHGAAYIWPLDRIGSSDAITTSLREHCARGGGAGYIFWEENIPHIQWLDRATREDKHEHALLRAQTLIFLPRGFSEKTKQRIQKSLFSENLALQEVKDTMSIAEPRPSSDLW